MLSAINPLSRTNYQKGTDKQNEGRKISKLTEAENSPNLDVIRLIEDGNSNREIKSVKTEKLSCSNDFLSSSHRICILTECECVESKLISDIAKMISEQGGEEK